MPLSIRSLVVLAVGFLALPGAAQTTVRTVSLPGASDVVVDASGRLLVAIGEQFSAADGLAVLDPPTGEVGDRLAVSGGLMRLALADDGRTLYGGLATSPGVARFDVAEWREVSRFSLGSDPVLGARYVNDLAVVPGQPGAVVVARRARAARPGILETALYLDGGERPQAAGRYAALGAGPGGALYGYDARAPSEGGSTGPDRFARLSVAADGLEAEEVPLASWKGPGGDYFGAAGDFVAEGGRLYGSNGAVFGLDPAQYLGRIDVALPTVPGAHFEYLAVRPLPDAGRVALLGRYDGTLYLVVADAESFDLLATAELPTGAPAGTGFVPPQRFERWSDDGLVYVADGAVVLIESTLLTEAYPSLVIDTPDVAFGTIDGGAERTVMLRNPGNATLRIEEAPSTDPAVSFSPLPLEIAPGGSVEGTVRVAPAASGDIEATLTFTGNAVAARTIRVSATAEVTDLLFLRPSFDFPTVPVGEQAAIGNTVFGTPYGPVTVSEIRVTDPRFEVVLHPPATGLPFTLDFGRNQNFDIVFRPDAEGRIEGLLIFESDAYLRPDTVRVSGTGGRATAAEDTDGGRDALEVPFPNPTTGDARVRFATARGGAVRVTLHDALGREVRVLLEEEVVAGARTVAVPLGGLPPGAYAVRIQAPGFGAARRLALVR